MVKSLWHGLPQRIRITRRDYRLRLVDDHFDAGKRGLCDTNARTITLNGSADDEPLAADTVLHEILHALCWHYHLDLGDAEERVVTCLATGLAQVMSDNPELADWWRGAVG